MLPFSCTLGTGVSGSSNQFSSACYIFGCGWLIFSSFESLLIPVDKSKWVVSSKRNWNILYSCFGKYLAPFAFFFNWVVHLFIWGKMLFCQSIYTQKPMMTKWFLTFLANLQIAKNWNLLFTELFTPLLWLRHILCNFCSVYTLTGVHLWLIELIGHTCVNIVPQFTVHVRKIQAMKSKEFSVELQNNIL